MTCLLVVIALLLAAILLLVGSVALAVSSEAARRHLQREGVARTRRPCTRHALRYAWARSSHMWRGFPVARKREFAAMSAMRSCSRCLASDPYAKVTPTPRL